MSQRKPVVKGQEDVVESETADQVIILDFNTKIPSSLRSVAPFLEEARAILKYVLCDN